ncbi:EpsG family protein [Flavobacterium sp. UBA6195]|uniref:EpsG family protein n=1 Tax=Flavobacterium sp. UBA6195 TaxID=1946554 RepID=UPI0025C55BD6|nr:EpsG family protein [Flavobacterium sp. UBA6195]
MNNTTINHNSQNNRSYIFLVFLFSPLVALIIAIKQYREFWTKNIVWMFSAFYGYSFVIGNAGSDINRYKQKFLIHHDLQMSIGEYFVTLFKEGTYDFIQPLLSFITSRFTSDFKIYLLLIGGFIGYFLSRNIWAVLNLSKQKPKWYGILFVLVFSFIYSVWDINVMRFTIGAHIFFYGAFKILVTKNRWGYFFIFLSLLVHFSFSIAFVIFLLYQILGKKFIKIYFIFFIISFFTSELNLNMIQSQLTFLPDNFIEKSDDYLNDDYKKKRDDIKENKNFRGKYYQSSLKWAIGILLTTIFLNRKKIKNNYILENLLAFCLLYVGVFNVLSFIPSMNRFQFVSYLFALTLIYPYFNIKLDQKEKYIIYLCTPLILFYFIVKFRIGFEFTGLLTLLGGPIIAAIKDNDIALIDFLR